jgi:hypothetical protein
MKNEVKDNGKGKVAIVQRETDAKFSLVDLPNELLIMIGRYSNNVSLFNMILTNKLLYQIFVYSKIWKFGSEYKCKWTFSELSRNFKDKYLLRKIASNVYIYPKMNMVNHIRKLADDELKVTLATKEPEKAKHLREIIKLSIKYLQDALNYVSTDDDYIKNIKIHLSGLKSFEFLVVSKVAFWGAKLLNIEINNNISEIDKICSALESSSNALEMMKKPYLDNFITMYTNWA